MMILLLIAPFVFTVTVSGGASELSFRFVTKYPAQEKPPLAIAPYHLAFDTEGNLYIPDPPNHRIVSLNPDGSFRLAWGRNGRGEGEFRYPQSVAVSSDNRVYVADRNNDRVQVFDTRGGFLSEIKNGFDFGTAGVVTVGVDQLLYVADTDKERIQVFTLDGGFIEYIEGGLDYPGSAVPISNDEVVVCDFYEDAVKVFVRSEEGWVKDREWYVQNPWQAAFDPDTNLIAVADAFQGILFFDLQGNEISSTESIAGDDFEDCRGVALGPDGRFAAADYGRGMVGVYDSAGGELWHAGDTPRWALNSPHYGITNEKDKRIIADTWNHRLALFDQDGIFANEVVLDDFWNVMGMDTAADGDVWLVNSGYQKAQLFHLAQDFSKIDKIELYGEGTGKLNDPYDLTVAGNWLIYVTDIYLHKIAVFDSDGGFVREWGGYGSAPGEFKYPKGITSAGDRIYVGDSSNNRIQVFDLDGSFIRSFGSKGTDPGDLYWPRGLVIHEDRIHVAEGHNNRVSVFSLDGDYLTFFGTEGGNDGEFASPQDCFVDDQGRIHVVDSGNNRVQIFEENHPPSAAFDENVPGFGLTAVFTSLSTDDEAVVETIWDFGDGRLESGIITEHTFPSEGTWTVTLTVKDAQGLSGTVQKEITVSRPPELAFDRTGLDIDPGGRGELILTGAEGLSVEYSLEGPGALDCRGYECAYTAPDQLGDYEQATLTAFLAESPGISTSTVIYLKNRVLTTIVPDPETLLMTEGDQANLIITAYYSDNSAEAVTEQVQWLVDPSSLAEVAGGVVTAMEPGTGTITASLGGREISVPFEIQALDSESQGATGAKAIIIAAGGVARSNTLWPYTNELTFDFYRMMLAKGLGSDDIYFISFAKDHDVDDDGVADPIERELDVTVRTIEWAFEWAQKAVAPEKPLFVYISGHGGQGILELNRKTGENMTAEQFKGFLNRIQPDVPVVVIIEACYSGSLIESISGTNRVIITSTEEESLAYFIEENSFSREFITASRQLTDLKDAFDLASNRLAGDFQGSAEQTPQLEDDGDKIPNTSGDGTAARNIPYGFPTGAVPPTIIATSGAREITDTSAEIWVKVHSPESAVKTVKARVMPPDYEPLVLNEDGITLPDLREVMFTWSPSKERWTALIDSLDMLGGWRFRITVDAGIAGKDYEDIVLTRIQHGEKPDDNPDDNPEGSVSMEITTGSLTYYKGDELVVQAELKADGKYDVYYAVFIPTGDFITLKEDETISGLNEVVSYKEGMVIDGTRSERLLTISVLPDMIPGEYMVIGLIVKNGEDIFAPDAVIAAGGVSFQFVQTEF